MFWLEHRVKANFSHPHKYGASYDDIKFILDYYFNPLMSLRKSLKIWYPELEFENRLKIIPASGKFVMTEINVLANNPIDESMSLMEMKIDLWLTVKCRFDFSDYPMDSQTCMVMFLNKERNHIKFRIYNQTQYQPFTTHGFNMQLDFIDGTCGCNDYQAGFKIKMTRILKPFVFKSYCPVIAIVLISAITFTIPLSAIPGRVSLAATLFLTLANIFITATVRADFLYF